MIIRRKKYSAEAPEQPEHKNAKLFETNARKYADSFGWRFVNYDPETTNIQIICKRGHHNSYKYEGLQLKYRKKDSICKICKTYDDKVGRIKDKVTSLGWEFLDYDEPNDRIKIKCAQGHEMEYFYNSIRTKVPEANASPCHQCILNPKVKVKKVYQKDEKLNKIQNMIEEMGWKFVEFDMDTYKVTITCHKNHQYIYRLDTLQAKYREKKDNEPEPCKLCLPGPNAKAKRTPEYMGCKLRSSGFDIVRNPTTIMESVQYRCANGCGNMGSVCYKAALNKVNVRSNICMSCSKISKKSDLEARFGVPIISVKADKIRERAQVTIKCIDCENSFTKSLNNCKPPYNRCGKCIHMDTLNPIEKVEAELGFKGFVWLGERSEYTGRTVKLTLLCPCGRICKLDYASVVRGRQCIECWRERRLATRDERYGNEVTLYDGTIIKLEGYTPFAVSLLTRIVGQEYIFTNQKQVPYFKWVDEKQAYHCYTPDIMVEYLDKKIIIEVKSMYTWEDSIVRYNLYDKMLAIKEPYEGEVWIIGLDEHKGCKLLFIQRVVDEELQFVNESILGIKPPCKINV